MKDGRTIDEIDTVVMLLGDGWWYDPSDHTINQTDNVSGDTVRVYDADTMEEFTVYHEEYMMDQEEDGYNPDAFLVWDKIRAERCKLIRLGKMGFQNVKND